MKTVGMMLVRNEEWIIAHSLRRALEWCDYVIVLMDRSTDYTWAIVNELVPGKRVIPMYNHDLTLTGGSDKCEWKEMELRERMLDRAREMKATHLAMIDADEFLTDNLTTNSSAIWKWMEIMKPGEILELPMIPCWRSFTKYRDDNSVWSRATISTVVRDDGRLSWSPAVDGYQHHHRCPYGAYAGKLRPLHRMSEGGVIHAQWASWPRVIAKHVWYRMMETISYPGRMTADALNRKYDQALDEGGIVLKPVHREWWGTDPVPTVDDTALTWFGRDIRRMLEEHGRWTFEGLDLKGYDYPCPS